MNGHETSGSRSLAQRFYLPVIMALVYYFILFTVYNLSWYIENRVLHFILADGVGFLYGFFIMASPLLLYPVMYSRGAAPVERVTGSLAVIIAWYIKEVIRMTGLYSPGESLFYLLMPIQFGVLMVAVAEISFSEFFCRFRASRKGRLAGNVLAPIPLAALVVSIIMLGLILYRGGETWFFRFYDLYKYMFL